VRAKADKAKEKIQIFLADWKDNSAVSSETSYVAITEALRTLGNFYSKNGQRARLPQSVIDDVLAQLDRAENSILEIK